MRLKQEVVFKHVVPTKTFIKAASIDSGEIIIWSAWHKVRRRFIGREEIFGRKPARCISNSWAPEDYVILSPNNSPSRFSWLTLQFLFPMWVYRKDILKASLFFKLRIDNGTLVFILITNWSGILLQEGSDLLLHPEVAEVLQCLPDSKGFLCLLSPTPSSIHLHAGAAVRLSDPSPAASHLFCCIWRGCLGDNCWPTPSLVMTPVRYWSNRGAPSAKDSFPYNAKHRAQNRKSLVPVAVRFYNSSILDVKGTHYHTFWFLDASVQQSDIYSLHTRCFWLLPHIIIHSVNFIHFLIQICTCWIFTNSLIT